MRVVRHPAVWSLPAMVLLVMVAWTFNEEFYGFWVNGDPQGDAQVRESAHTTRIFRYTSGVLCGQVLALWVGVLLARGHHHRTALALAVPVAALLAGVGVAAAYLLAGASAAAAPFDDPVVVRALLCELAAYPLYAVAGVGLGVLLDGSGPVRRLLGPLLVLGWCVATLTGLLQDDGFNAPGWLLWAVPPIAAGAALALAGLSVNVWFDPPVVTGDWGRSAGTALLVGALAYAVVLNLLGLLAAHRRRRRVDAGTTGTR